MGLIQITYNEQYFRGSSHSTTAPGGYDNYRWDSYLTEDSSVLANKFVQRALAGGIDLTGKKVLVLGCAYGFLVKYLRALNVDAFGMDISAYAISQANDAAHFLVGDMRLDADYKRAKTLAGLTKNQDKFEAIIDEDALCCFTDSEAITICSLMRNYSTYQAAHLVDTSPNLINWYNFHTIAEWKSLIGIYPKEKWYARYSNWTE